MFDQSTATLIGIIVIVVLVISDIVLANDEVPGNAPSQVVRWLSRYTVGVPFGLGVLMGHWFHPIDDFDPILGDNSPMVLLGIGLVLGIGGLIFGLQKRPLAPWPWAILGFVLGWLLWPVVV